MMSGLWSYIKSVFLSHLLIGAVFVSSGLIVNFLMLLTYIFIWPWNKALYRKIITLLGYSHWCQMTFLGQWWSGSTCTLYMDKPTDISYIGHEHSIIVMNHKYDIDWLMGWMLSERFGLLGGTRIYGKWTLKLVPLIGWAWIFCECIFLVRQWEKDKATITRDLKNLMEYPQGYWITLLLFPEGTRFTEEKHKSSLEVAQAKGFPILKHHLLPRTKGFVQSVQGVQGKVSSILDLTIGFRSDGAPPTLMSIINGRACHSEVFVRRIPLETIPCETDEACANWLMNLFKEKDEIYDQFTHDGTFKRGTKVEIPRRLNDLVMTGLWVLVIGVPILWYLGSIVLTGSIYLRITALSVLAIAYVVVRMMIGVTVIDKGSSYGKEKKTH